MTHKPQVIAAIFLAWACPIHADDIKYYTANFTSEDVKLEVEVNGLPLYKIPEEGNSASLASGIGEYLKKGGNEVVLKITPTVPNADSESKAYLWTFALNSGAAIAAQNPVPEFKIERLADLAGTEPNSTMLIEVNGAQFAQLKHRGLQDGGTVRFTNNTRELAYLPSEGVTSNLVATLHLPNAPLDSLPWLAPQVIPDGNEIIAIKQQVQDLHASLMAKNWSALRTLLGEKLSRIATATGGTVDEIFDSTVNLYNTIFTSDGFMLDPLDSSQLTVTPVGSLNLVRVTFLEKDPISGQGTDYKLQLPVRLSKIGDQWKIVD